MRSALTRGDTCWQVQKKLRGCIVFTSSAAAAIASPFTALYAATKSFISSFGASLAVEVRHHGIDVLVFHPSPVNTRCAPSPPHTLTAWHCRGIACGAMVSAQVWWLTWNSLFNRQGVSHVICVSDTAGHVVQIWC